MSFVQNVIFNALLTKNSQMVTFGILAEVFLTECYFHYALVNSESNQVPGQK